jgi:GNAT superfamily N-acetyltransferase
MRMDVRRARPEDLDQVTSLLEEARAWLHARGIQQWPTTYPRSLLTTDIAQGEVYLAHVNGEPAGTLTLQWSGETVWEHASQDAAYVHRLVVRRKFAGQGIGLELLRWAEGAAVCAGKHFLRLDCWAGNLALCEYYERAGFESRGVRQIDDYQAHLFEKGVGGSSSD